MWYGNKLLSSKHVLLFCYSGRIPVIRDIATAIDHGFGGLAIDKIFYAGQGLYEILFAKSVDRDAFLSQPTVILFGQVVHVLEWQPIKKIKDALLSQCPVWVEL